MVNEPTDYMKSTIYIAEGRRKDDQDFVTREYTVEEFVKRFFSTWQRGPKDGKCILQGGLISPKRLGKNVTANYILMLDHDSGESTEAIIEKIKAMGLLAIVWNTHSHMTPESEFAQDAVQRYMKAHKLEDLDVGIRAYMREEKGVLDNIIASVTDVSLEHREGGAKYVVTHAPMPKTRSLFFLDEPFEFVVEGVTQKERLDEWKARYKGFAQRLGVIVDEKTSDASRLMYTPRIAKSADENDYVLDFIDGATLTLDDMPRALTPREIEKQAREEADKLLAGIAASKNVPSGAPAAHAHVVFQTPGLARFLAVYGRGFQAAQWLSSKIEPRRIVDTGKLEFECPLDDMHSNAGDPKDTAFFAADAELSTEPPTGWTMQCGHATCSSHVNGDRALYLDAACVKYGVAHADELIEYVDPTIVEVAVSDPQFYRTQNGSIRAGDPRNVKMLLEKRGIVASQDKFSHVRYISIPDVCTAAVLEDLHLTRLRFICGEDPNPGWAFMPTLDAVHHAVLQMAAENAYDPLLTYMYNLPVWDGVDRIDRVFIDYAGVEDTPINREFSRVFFTGLAARALDPGCKFDCALVLEGPQGIGKSTLLASLMPEPKWFTDNVSTKDDAKVLIEATEGKWLVEIPEFSGIRYADLEHVKATITRQVDRARLAYGRETTSRPRRFVFAITSNRGDYLRDTTGNRRFMPIHVHAQVQLAAIEAIRDQLYAEAKHKWLNGALAGVSPEFWAEAAAVQAERLEDNEYSSRLEPIFAQRAGRVRAADVYEFLGINAANNGAAFAQRRVAECMATLGWAKGRVAFGAADDVPKVQAFTRVPRGWSRKPSCQYFVDAHGTTVTLGDVSYATQGFVGGTPVTANGEAKMGAVAPVDDKPRGLRGL